MKNTYRKLWASLSFIAVALLTSCVDEYEYHGAEVNGDKPLSEQGYIISDLMSVDLQNSDPQKFEITVARGDASQAGTIKLVSSNSKFNVPQSLEFAANEKSKKVVITFDIAETSKEDLSIKIADDQAYQYGITNLNLTVRRYVIHHANWKSWYYGWSDNKFDVWECPVNTFTIKGGRQEEWMTAPLADFSFTKDANNNVFMEPQYIHEQNWNDAGPKPFWIMALNDASWDKFNTADIQAVTNKQCGTFDPEEDLFHLLVHWYSPDYGWWNNSEQEWIAFLD